MRDSVKKDFQNFKIQEDSEFEIIYNQILLDELDFQSKINIYCSGIFIGNEGEMNKISYEECLNYLEETEQYEKCSEIKSKIENLKLKNLY